MYILQYCNHLHRMLNPMHMLGSNTNLSPLVYDAGKLGVQPADQQDEGQISLSKSSRGIEQTSIHTLCTSNGSPYLNFQTRIM